MLKEWSKTAAINTDRNLAASVHCGMGLNSDMGGQIVSSMLEHYRFPDSTFVGSPESVDALQQALEQDRRKAALQFRGEPERHAVSTYPATTPTESKTSSKQKMEKWKMMSVH